LRRGTAFALHVGMSPKHIVFIISLAISSGILICSEENTSPRDVAAIPGKSRITPPYPDPLKIKSLQKKEIVVAVIDTGIDLDHKAFRGKIWINEAEDLNRDGRCTLLDNDGRDQDGNGYVDDCRGWNFANNNNNPMDTHGHGTHISGIISAISNVFPSSNIKIMPLKYYDPSIPKNHIKNTVSAIKYAILMGARVINYSAGGDTPSKEEKSIIVKARKKGILFVAAAGNEKNDVLKVPYYPSSYNLPNILSVTAIDKKGVLLSKSNWGKTIDIAAPGANVLSTLPGGKYGNMSGTSMAASFVTGLISVIMSREDCSAFKAAKLVKNSAIHSKKLLSRVYKNRVVNPLKALERIEKDYIVQRKIARIFSKASVL